MCPSPLVPPVVNRRGPVERLIRLLMFALCALGYAAGLLLLFRGLENRVPTVSVPKAVRLSFLQLELQAEPTPTPVPEPAPEPDVVREIEEADVSLEEVPEKRTPEPRPAPLPEESRPEAPVANVSQEAGAPEPGVSAESVQSWVVALIEKEKYYPPAAERMGLRGMFTLRVSVDDAGVIQTAEVVDGRGHRILRQALEKMMAKLSGRRFESRIGEPVEFDVEFEFE